MFDIDDTYDVFMCGGGPVGLVTAYGLQRMGIKTCVTGNDNLLSPFLANGKEFEPFLFLLTIAFSLCLKKERLEKSKLPMYERACSLFPRSLEMFDRYDLLHPLAQASFVSRSCVNYDKGGKLDNTRGMLHVFDAIPGKIFLEYMLNIRLKYSEEIIQREYESIGGIVAVGWELTRLSMEKEQCERDGYPVKVEMGSDNSLEKRAVAGHTRLTMELNPSGNASLAQMGAQSTARYLSGITSTSDKTALRWIRIDSVVETDMPDSRQGFTTLESPTHGNVLWVSLDHGRSRVGYAMSAALNEKYGENLTQEQAIEEAKVAFKPFSLEF